jgi:hypothetical protein
MRAKKRISVFDERGRTMKRSILQAFLFSGIFSVVSAQTVWTKRISGTTSQLNSVIWTGNQLVTVGNGVITSPDGVTWTSRSATNGGNSVTWTGSQLVTVVGSTSRTSPDGMTWTSHTLDGIFNPYMNSVTWTGNQLVAVGGYFTDITQFSICTSPDGGTWTQQAITNWDLFSVTWTGSKLVAVGGGYPSPGAADNSGAILTSSNATSWTKVGGGPILYCVTWTGSQLVAVGGPNNNSIAPNILTSPDGVNWTGRNSGHNFLNLNSVTWGGQLVAAGDSGIILTSPDGITWTKQTTGAKISLRSVTWTGQQFVAVGDSGIILTSPGTVGVFPHISAKNDLSLRLAQSQLFATLPISMLGQAVHTAVYTIAGKKLIEVHGLDLNGGISLPVDALYRGRYLFEAAGENERVIQLFNLSR